MVRKNSNLSFSDNRNIFQIPRFFLLLSKVFSLIINLNGALNYVMLFFRPRYVLVFRFLSSPLSFLPSSADVFFAVVHHANGNKAGWSAQQSDEISSESIERFGIKVSIAIQILFHFCINIFHSCRSSAVYVHKIPFFSLVC